MANGLEIMSQTIWGKLSTLHTRVQLLFAALGEAIMPVFHKVIDTVIILLDHLEKFAHTPVGQELIKLIFFMGVFLVLLGAVLLLTNGLRFALIMSAKAFGDVTKAKIIDTIATRGLAAGLGELAIAAWASLGPYLLLVGAGALVFSAMNKETKEMLKNMLSFGGAAAGGVGFLDFIKQVWGTWNGKNFTLNSETWKELNGHLDATHTRLAKIIIKLHEFFEGVGTGFIETLKMGITIVFNIFKVGYLLIEGFVIFIIRLLQAFGVNIDNNISTLKRWKVVGEIVGFVLAFWFMKVAFSIIASGLALIWNAAVAMVQFIAGAVRLLWWIGEVIVSLFTQETAAIAAGEATVGVGTAMEGAAVGINVFNAALMRQLGLLLVIAAVVMWLIHLYGQWYGDAREKDTKHFNKVLDQFPADQQDRIRGENTFNPDKLDSLKKAGVKMGPLGIPIPTEEFQRADSVTRAQEADSAAVQRNTPVARPQQYNGHTQATAAPAEQKKVTIVNHIYLDGQEIARVVKNDIAFDNARNS